MPGPYPNYPCLDAALEASRPALLRLYADWQDRRQTQVVEYVSAFQSSHGHPPAAADVAAALEPRISESAARWYVERINGHDRDRQRPAQYTRFFRIVQNGARTDVLPSACWQKDSDKATTLGGHEPMNDQDNPRGPRRRLGRWDVGRRMGGRRERMMLTRRSQIQAIADHLAGLANNNRQFQLPDFEEPWQSALPGRPGGAGRTGDPEALRAVLANRPDRDAILGAILAAVPGEGLLFPSLREIAGSLPPIEWLWPDWIPRGMITLLGAVPGAGKSYLAMDLSRRIIVDEPFPDGAPQPLPGGNVIYVDAESVPQILSERAQLWQMDTSRLYLMRPAGKLYIDFGDPADRDHLVEMALHLEPALIVVDSLGSISSKGENNVEDVRDLLGFLNRLALDTQCGLLLIHHLRKRGVLPLVDVLTVDDFRGSSHIIAMSRSVLGLSIVQAGPEPDRNGPRRLEVVKTNLARLSRAPGHDLQAPASQGRLDRVYDRAAAAVPAADAGRRVRAWLVEACWRTVQGNRGPWKIVARGGQGFSRRTVYRARELLGEPVGNTDSRTRIPENRWCLVAQEGEGA